MKVKSNHLGSRKRRRVVLDLLFNITLYLRFDRYFEKYSYEIWTFFETLPHDHINVIDLFVFKI